MLDWIVFDLIASSFREHGLPFFRQRQQKRLDDDCCRWCCQRKVCYGPAEPPKLNENQRVEQCPQAPLKRRVCGRRGTFFAEIAKSAIMIAAEAKMAQIIVRNLEEQVKGRLQHRAKRHGRSMEEEAREILRNALKEEEAPRRGLGSEIVALFQGQGIGLKEGEEIPEWRGYPVEPISFDE
jgi:plasmid stability protein